jgi:hypothetical protein
VIQKPSIDPGENIQPIGYYFFFFSILFESFSCFDLLSRHTGFRETIGGNALASGIRATNRMLSHKGW